MLFTSTSLAALLVGAAQVQAHMRLEHPPPFGWSSDPQHPIPNTSPLSNPPLTIGSNVYPCQSNDYSFTFQRTQLAAGKLQSLTLGSPEPNPAVHGGGSCQVSLTTDLEPSPKSDFKVIHSIIGGCPERHMAGNSLGATPKQLTYDFTVPDSVEEGNYTLAWTWFNRVGNREMYMNCAPVSVSGSGSTGTFNKLPSLFLANIPDVDCGSVADGTDLIFPSPGPQPEKIAPTATDTPTSWSQALPTKACYAPVGGNQQNVIASSDPPAATNIVTSAAINGGGAYVATSATASFVAASSAVSAVPYSTPSASTDATSGSCVSPQVSCPEEGRVLCIGQSQFGVCSSRCATPQALAAGISCTKGTISKRALPWLPRQARKVRAEREWGTLRWN